MPAKSVAMRRAAGMARAIQKGEMEAVPGTPSAQMAQMPTPELDKFAKTKEAGLPEHKRPRPKGKRGRNPQGMKQVKTNLSKKAW